jgi:hypothetical protein
MKLSRLSLLFSGLLLLSGAAMADSASGEMWYTTFNGGTNVWKVNYNYNGSTFVLSGNTGVVAVNGADGLLFGPDGNLMVAGQNSAHVTEVTTAGATVSTANTPGVGSYHLALDSNAANATMYSINNGSGGDPNGSAISRLTLAGGGLGGPGTALTVTCAVPGCSTDVRGIIFDPVNNTWYYGTAGDGSTTGQFGTITFSGNTATLHVVLNNVPAHGLSFDPFTNDIIFNSANLVEQYDPTCGCVVSTLNVGGQELDQASEDGKGHLFVASNTGNLLFADYDASGLIGTSSFASLQFLNNNLDDIAPLSAAGSNPVPEPASLLLLGSGLVGLLRKRMK